MKPPPLPSFQKYGELMCSHSSTEAERSQAESGECQTLIGPQRRRITQQGATIEYDDHLSKQRRARVQATTSDDT